MKPKITENKGKGFGLCKPRREFTVLTMNV